MRSRSRRPSAPAAYARAQSDLRRLARATDAIAGEVAARGPPATRPAVLKRWRRDAEAQATALRRQRRAFIEAQLATLGLARRSRGLRLHLGAADSALPGWVSIDHWPAPLAMDLRWGLPFAKGAAQAVYLCHVLEHCYYPDEALAVMADIHRVLAREGVARIVVPDIEQCLRAYVRGDRRFFAARRAQWPWWPPTATRLESFLGYAGVGASPDAFVSSHKFGYDYETLRSLLRRAGFRRIERSAYMRSRDPALRIDDASHVAGAKHGRRYYSLFVEARP
jgi:predicted SAM-dependent methyltransferase